MPLAQILPIVADGISWSQLRMYNTFAVHSYISELTLPCVRVYKATWIKLIFKIDNETSLMMICKIQVFTSGCASKSKLSVPIQST